MSGGFIVLNRCCFTRVVMVLTAVLVVWTLCSPVLAGWESLFELKAPDPCEAAWFGFSVSIDNDFVAISAPWKDNKRGAVYIYKVNDPELEYTTTLIPPDLDDTDWFGYSVCIDSNRIVVGTYYADEVYVFDYNGTGWSNNPEILSVAGSDDHFGYSVSIDANTIVVGAPGTADSTGAAYVFDYNGVSWGYKQTLNYSGPDYFNGGDMFGNSVAVDGDVIVVGAKWDTLFNPWTEDGYREGSVFVFRLSGGIWSLEQKIGGANRLDQVGYSVAVSGDTFVTGVHEYDYGANTRAGAAFVYKWGGSSWVKEATLYSSDPNISYKFGNSVAIDGNSIIVGEILYDGKASNSGAAFLFEKNGSSWSQGEIMEDPNGSENDYFGYSVAIDGELAITGAYKDDGGETDSGAAFIFLFLIADLDQNGLVDFKDFAILASQWLQEPGQPSADIAPLYNSDNIVNALDLKLLAEQWLKVGSPYIP